MTKFIFKNHQLLPEKQAQLSINERGFLFGDGIFETIKVFNHKLYDFKNHELRMKSGLKALKISADISDLQEKAEQLISKNSLIEGILKISISRGVGSAGYLPTDESEALIIIQTFPKREIPKKIALGVSKITAPTNNFGKTMNALPYIMTKIEARDSELFDCVMLSSKKFISETSSANIFWMKNGKIFTPSKSCNALNGTTKKKLIKLASIKIFETEAKISALKNADEIFLTNSSFLVLPIDEFLGRKLSKEFGKEFLKLMEEDLEISCKN